MVGLDITKIKKIYDQFPWDTREDYRVLRQIRPDFDLPSDTDISKVWGSFSNFKKELKVEEKEEFELLCSSGAMATNLLKADENDNELLNDESKNMLRSLERKEIDEKTKDELMKNGFKKFFNIKFLDIPEEPKEVTYIDVPVLTEEQQIIRTVRRVLGNNFIFNRNQYRAQRSSNSELPSCDKINKVFGSFGKFKELLLSSNETPELTELPISEEQQIINLVLSIWKDVENLKRDDYRDKRRTNPELNLPSNDKIDKLFGSFGNFKSFVLESVDGNSWDLNPQQVKEIREKVKQRRIEIFGEKRKPYEWEIRSRSLRRGAWVVNS